MARRYKKVDGGHGHHGGAWKVAYADFVTAMMALFMVLWLLATTDSASRKEISNYFRSGILPEGDMAMNHAAQIKPSVIEEAATPPPEADQATMSDKENTAKQISDKLGRLAALDDEMAEVIKNVKIKITPEGVLIETVDEGDNLLFESASAKLNEPLQRFLKALAPMVVKVGRPVEINGHTDARQFAAGSKINNWDLSYQRAAAARQILETNGVPSTQVVGVFARGSSQLYEPANPLSPHNRRLSFLLRINTASDKTQRLDQLGQDTMGDVAAPTPDAPKVDEKKVDEKKVDEKKVDEKKIDEKAPAKAEEKAPVKSEEKAPAKHDEHAAKEPTHSAEPAKHDAKPADAHAHK